MSFLTNAELLPWRELRVLYELVFVVLSSPGKIFEIGLSSLWKQITGILFIYFTVYQLKFSDKLQLLSFQHCILESTSCAFWKTLVQLAASCVSQQYRAVWFPEKYGTPQPFKYKSVAIVRHAEQFSVIQIHTIIEKIEVLQIVYLCIPYLIFDTFISNLISDLLTF